MNELPLVPVAAGTLIIGPLTTTVPVPLPEKVVFAFSCNWSLSCAVPEPDCTIDGLAPLKAIGLRFSAICPLLVLLTVNAFNTNGEAKSLLAVKLSAPAASTTSCVDGADLGETSPHPLLAAGNLAVCRFR